MNKTEIKKVLDQFEKIIIAKSWKGSRSMDEWDEIDDNYKKIKKQLIGDINILFDYYNNCQCLKNNDK